ncbi:hypothetical protein SAMN05444274_101117 [Mariniphaga anaerophila]|uniref:Uncharacterized protein n=1 Tax=Mariniphaga anaerophila TaxID=1484053 RepID=A0A1M4SR34_9BACT|nr:hypothetical protein [Mariniphaga anaerophila]SHE34690.1 hypothetical protein SAMN05444274_101117 [Mariniphaga anaerophila]
MRNSITLTLIMILLAMVGYTQTNIQQYPSGELNLSDLETKFIQLCDLAVRKLSLPERQYSQDTPLRKVPYYADAYAVRALGVAYDLTGNEKYLNTMKIWSDRMITNQQKMIPKGGYYMNYGRKPFETDGEWFVADCGEISMGLLSTATRCRIPMERERYINSVESFANLVLENYIDPEGGIRDGMWSKSNDSNPWIVGYAGQVFFKLFDEKEQRRYLYAGINAINWLANHNVVREIYSKDSLYLEFNPPINNDASSGVIRAILDPYTAGVSHIFSGQFPTVKKVADEQIDVIMKWFESNLLGKGESGTYEKYDVRKGKVGGKMGYLPCQIYILIQHNILPKSMMKIADKELQRIVAEIFSYDEQLLTELTMFSMCSMAERISPGSLYRNIDPVYQIVIKENKN